MVLTDTATFAATNLAAAADATHIGVTTNQSLFVVAYAAGAGTSNTANLYYVETDANNVGTGTNTVTQVGTLGFTGTLDEAADFVTA